MKCFDMLVTALPVSWWALLLVCAGMSVKCLNQVVAEETKQHAHGRDRVSSRCRSLYAQTDQHNGHVSGFAHSS